MALLAAAFLVGCSSDVGTANNQKVDTAVATKKQQGQGGIKAARGGGIDEGVVPAPAGVKTGMPGAGAKSR